MSTKFLVTEEKPDGYRLEDILTMIRNDILQRATKIMEDERVEAAAVMGNNIKILGFLSESIALAANSSDILDKSFGRHESDTPRIGKA
jgi:CBS domain-containing protein